MGTDMTEENAFGFEGFEKRLEVEFEEVYGHSSYAGLRSLSRCELDEMLTAAECTIVSELHNRWFDAYVLSESSLFVYPRRIVLKTCGKTQLLNAVPVLLCHAANVSLKAVRCKYSRGTFIFPDAQPFPYTSFADETRVLDELFAPMIARGCRSAHVLDGHPDFDKSSWHIYTATAAKEYAPAPIQASLSKKAIAAGESVQTSSKATVAGEDCIKTFPDMSVAAGECVEAFRNIVTEAGDSVTDSSAGECVEAFRDTVLRHLPSSMYTLEMCMTHLDPSTTSHFMNLSGSKSGADMTRTSGISDLLPNSDICDFAFTPCGYSMNGMEEDALSTIHITPEEGHSYASFEAMGYDPHSLDLGALVNRVVACFKPGSLVMSIHASGYGNSRLESIPSSWDTSSVLPRGYVCNSSVRQELAGDGVVAFHTFTKGPLAGRGSVIPQPLRGRSYRAEEWGFGFSDKDDGDSLIVPCLQKYGRRKSLLELYDTPSEMIGVKSYTAEAELACSPYDLYPGDGSDRMAYAHNHVAYAHGKLEIHQSLFKSCGALLNLVDAETELFRLWECKVIVRLRPNSNGSHTELSPNAEEMLRKSKKMGLQVIGFAADTGMETWLTVCAYKGTVRAAAIKVFGRAEALGMPPLKLLAKGQHCAATILSCE